MTQKNRSKLYHQVCRNRAKGPKKPKYVKNERKCTKSTYFTVLKYHITLHCIVRYAHRVLNYYGFIPDTMQEEIAQVIIKEIGEIFPGRQGLAKLAGDFNIVIRNGTAITILKDK